MYLKAISKFIIYLEGKDKSLDEILNRMVRVEFNSLDALSIGYGELNGFNEVIVKARSGTPTEVLLKSPQVVPMSQKNPVTEAIRTGKIKWINTLPDWGPEFPSLPYNYDIGGKTYIALPVLKSNTPIGAFAIVCRPAVEPTLEIETYLASCLNIFSLYYFRKYPPIIDKRGATLPKKGSPNTAR